MTDEVRDISIVVQATQAINSLVRVGSALDNLNGATGKTDAELRKVDRTINKASNEMLQAARTVARLKTELRSMSKELTASGRENTALASRLATANKRLAEQRAIVQTQKGVVQSLLKENLRLAESYNKVGAAATRAGAAQANAVPGGGGNKITTPRASLMGDEALTNSLRYSLYDVAATFGIVGAAATMASTAVFRAGITFDKNFANVVRTSQVTGGAIEWLKNEFLDLQSVIPVTSEDLAAIGTLGAQMGVAAGNLARFTEITAKFSATAGISVDESATALSRLDQLLPDVNGNYELLASTILRTGVNAVATESQIVRGTNQIAAMGRIAGLTTPEIVALSSTLSSLGFSPELQRSIVTSSFSRILTATSTVTAQTEKFGAVLNMTGKQFQQAWNEDALGTYKRLMETIAGRGDAVTVLQDLGLASQRLTPNLLKLGQNTDVLNTALADTTDEWGKNGELTRQYGVISKTVSARIQVMAQSWEALLVTLDQSETVVGPLVDGLTGVLKVLRNLARNPAAASLASVAAIIGTLVGVMALGAAGLAAMSAGYIAIINAQNGLTAATAGNTAAQMQNNAAKALGLGPTLALTGATTANTAAVVGNTAANTAGAASLLNFSSKAITALPAVLKWTGIIGLAAAAVAGLVTLVSNAPDLKLDLDKLTKGIATPEDTFEYNTDSMKENIKLIKLAEVELKKFRADNNFIAADIFEGNINNWKDELSASKSDLSDEILALGSVEEQIAAVNTVAKQMGMSQGELLNILPDVSSVIGDQAEAMAIAAEEADKLESAMALWAASLGSTDEDLAKLTSGVQSAAGSFLNFGEALAAAYEKDGDGNMIGGGLQAFIDGMNGQIADFESFYADLGTLTQKGGVQLAALFAEQGPAAAQALTDSLTLSNEQIGQIEAQMSLAAFYASEEFANTFAQNNALLAQVWQQTNSSEAVAAFNAALSESMKGGTIDPAVLASLAEQFGIDLDIGLIPSIDPGIFDTAVSLLDATITPVVVPVTTTVGQGDFEVTEQVMNWIVEMEGHTIVLNVDPNTAEGQRQLTEWRNAQYTVPVKIGTTADTSGAAAAINAFRLAQSQQTIWLKTGVRTAGGPGGAGGNTIATGGIIHNQSVVRSNYPAFARGSNGAIFRGPGTGTSDSIIARVSNGEAITRAKAVRYYGSRMMEDINKMRFPRFATGRTPQGYPGTGGTGAQTIVNATVVQNYPTTRDPIKTMKHEAEAVVAGLWS